MRIFWTIRAVGVLVIGQVSGLAIKILAGSDKKTTHTPISGGAHQAAH